MLPPSSIATWMPREIELYFSTIQRSLGSALVTIQKGTRRNLVVRCPWKGARSREPDGREPQAPPAAAAREARLSFLPMIGFLSLAALWADSPRFAAPHRSTSRHSRRPRLAIALAASRRLSKALRRGRKRGGGGDDLAPLGGVGRGGAPPRGPLGNAVRARAVAAERGWAAPPA